MGIQAIEWDGTVDQRLLPRSDDNLVEFTVYDRRA